MNRRRLNHPKIFQSSTKHSGTPSYGDLTASLMVLSTPTYSKTSCRFGLATKQLLTLGSRRRQPTICSLIWPCAPLIISIPPTLERLHASLVAALILGYQRGWATPHKRRCAIEWR